ncbi:MAG: type VI secretion system Vgr family protein, partial [Candidatus Latescibacterota bacterium]
FRENFNRDYLIAEVTHEVNQSGFLISGLGKTSSDRDQAIFYRNSFKAIPSDIQYRPERTAEKPRMAGTLHARVDAEGSGNYAELDDQGRYKVRLPFDTDTAHGAGKASHFIRMAQPYSGADYGLHFPLHKGSEVLLTFVDGDPDRPIIAGAVPNPETASPVTSENQTKSIFRDNYGNEMVFDSTPGDEHIRLYSPHHNSLLELGKSITEMTDSNKWDWLCGNSAEVALGNKFTCYLGNNIDMKFGLIGTANTGFVNDLLIGGKYGLFVGYEQSAHYGPEFKFHKGATVEKSEADKSSIAEKNNIISATDKINLVGGANNVANGKTSIAVLDKTEISLSFGKNRNPDTLAESQKAKSAQYWVPAVFTGLTALIGIPVTAATAAYTPSSIAFPIITGLVGAAETAAAIVCAILVAYYSKIAKTENVKTVSHFDSNDDAVDTLLKLSETQIYLAVNIPEPKASPFDAHTKMILDDESIMMKIDHADKSVSMVLDHENDAISLELFAQPAAPALQGANQQASPFTDASIKLQRTDPSIRLKTGNSGIDIKHDGTIFIENIGAMNGNKQIQINAQENAFVTSINGDVILDASKGQVWAKGKIKHKNFIVLA